MTNEPIVCAGPEGFSRAWNRDGSSRLIPTRKPSLQRLLGKLVSELRKGREVRIEKFGPTGNLLVRVYQGGIMDESYTPDLEDDLPPPAGA